MNLNIGTKNMALFVPWILCLLLVAGNGVCKEGEREAMGHGKLVYLYVFDDLSDWEIGYVTAGINNLALQAHPPRYHVKTFSQTGDPIRTAGGLRIMPDIRLEDVVLADAAMLILPGGAGWEAKVHEDVLLLAKEFHTRKIPIAAICGATLGIARAGLLDSTQHTSNSREYIMLSKYTGGHNYREALAVRDNRIITSPGTAPVDFAREVFAELALYTDEVLDAWYRLFTTSSVEAYEDLIRALAGKTE